MKTKRHKKSVRRTPRRTYRKNPAKTVVDPHAARELALCYDNERYQQKQKEAIINNLAKKMAKGVYNVPSAVKLWSYAAKSGADAYAKTFGSHGDTGASMFNAATRMEAARILEEENRDYVKERSERFTPKPKLRKNPSPKHYARKPGPGSAKVVLTRRIMAGLKKYPFDVGGLVTVYGIPREKAAKIMSSNKSGNTIYRILSSH